MSVCACVGPERGPLMGKLMAFSQERPAEGMEGRRKEERQSWRAYGGVPLQTISDKEAKTNGGKDWVKEQEELREGEKKQKMEMWKRKIQKKELSQLWRELETGRLSVADIPVRNFAK